MSYNAYILKKLEADKYLALILEKSVKEVGKETLKQAQLVYSGAERMSWYLSCLSKNYQDVCEKLHKEDKRFIMAILKIIPGFRLNLPHIDFEYGNKGNNHTDIYIKNNVISFMLELFTENIFSELHYERKIILEKILIQLGANYVADNLTNRSIAYAVASAIYMSAGLRVALEGTLTSLSKKGISTLGIYGYVKVAADAADRLKLLNKRLYSAFYIEGIEMLYFIIEPIVTKIDHKFRYALSEREIASDIMRLIN